MATEPGSGYMAPALSGWDQGKWSDPTHQTTKYAVGRVLAKYPPTTAGIQQAWAELQTLYPGATFNGKDQMSGLPGTLGPVDVLHGASRGGTGWGWRDTGAQIDQGAQPPAAATAQPRRASAATTPSLLNLMQPSTPQPVAASQGLAQAQRGVIAQAPNAPAAFNGKSLMDLARMYT